MFPPKGSTDAHGNDLQVGTNCLGPYLLYQQLLPLLSKTAASAPTASVRVAWAGSIAVHVAAPRPHGVVLDDAGRPTDRGVKVNYAQTKVGNAFLARELAKSTPQTGVVHAAFNPGNLRTELQRHWSGLDAWFTVSSGPCIFPFPFPCPSPYAPRPTLSCVLMGLFSAGKGQVRGESSHLRRLHGALHDPHAGVDARQERGLRLSLGSVRPPPERDREVLEDAVRRRDGDRR